jgi:superfamily I DNA and/or RNA helicase
LAKAQSSVIRREADKKRKHMPVRELIHRSRSVTQAVKPCFMMSPLAVSQYLPSDLRFDVVIFDEASQVAPQDAINCIYRGTALITAGDKNQLPPTNFFGGAGDDNDEWTDESEDAKDFESILDLAKASGAYKSLTLRWHYRSRHEDLIAFSNASFYKGKLITFPGAEHRGPDVGVELFEVSGTYRRGTSRDNPIEAALVAQRVLHHYSTRPGLSVGVVTFSETQKATIEAAVEDARRLRPDLDSYFEENRLHGFFVKNLESVQGDERDVMIFSIGYGRDEIGKMSMNFGPLNRAGGWRRLNVAVTRARYRNEIVSSIQASDITASATSEGVRHLRRYLDYAARGVAALALDMTAEGDAESPFEESVITTVRSWGYDVTPQVGAAGYRIDIGVQHPDHPGAYVLGVECDGYQ